MKKNLLHMFAFNKQNGLIKVSLFVVLAFIITAIFPVSGFAQNTVIDNKGEAYFFHSNDYPNDATPSWGDNGWAANGITHDKNNWYISSVKRTLLGFTGNDWILWKIPVSERLDQDFDNNSNVIKWRLGYFNNPPDTFFKKYGHNGDIDHCTVNNVDYILAPLTGGGKPIVAFFLASNLHFINYAFLDSTSQTDVGWCAYSNGFLYTSKDDADSIFKYQISWNTILNHSNNHSGLKKIDAKALKDSNGTEFTFRNMQGGEFTSGGDLLYVNCGVVPSRNPEDGIHVFRSSDWKEIQRSTNTNILPPQSGCFNYSFDNYGPWGEEPEGLTIWDLDGLGAPFAHGQLHVLMDDHNAVISNKVTLKHYKSFKRPDDITVFATTTNGEPATNSSIAAFLNQGTNYANCATITYTPHLSIFPPGKTPVIFTVTDHVSVNVKCTSYVIVKNKQDECSTATRIYACDKTIVDNYAASRSTGLPPFGCNTGTAKDVWFIIYPPSPFFSVETYQVTGGLTDLDMQAFSGTCGNLREIACDDSSGDNRHAKVTFQNLPESKPIYIRITDHDGTHFGKFGIYTKKIATGSDIFSSTQFISGDGPRVHDYPALKGDVNGDGKTDLIFVGQDWSDPGLNIRTKMSNGDGSYTAYSQILGDGAGVHDQPTLTGDMNGDGKTDLVFIYQHLTTGLEIRTKISNGNGTYTAYKQILGDGAGVHDQPTLTGDVNGDGKTDLIFIYQHPTTGLEIRTKMSNGNGTYTAYKQILGDGAGVHDQPTLTGDVNGDGKTDLIFIYQHPTTGLEIRTKMSNGNGTYTAYRQILGDGGGVHDYRTLTGDVNGDGKTDLIFRGQDWKACGLNIRVKFSKGDGTWCQDWQSMSDGDGVHQYPTLAGDMNGDGKTDLVFVFDVNNQGLTLRTKMARAIYSCTQSSAAPQGDDIFIIYPNPTNGIMHIKTNDPDEFEVSIFDITKRLMLPRQRFTFTKQIDLTFLANGIYFVDIYDSKTDKRVVKKIVKMR